MPKILALLKSTFVVAVACAATAASAQGYPQRPVKWVVPYAPGGASDVLARSLTERLSASFGQRVLVDNRPGAGGNIGSDAVAKSPPDGYTLLQVTDGNTISPSIFQTLSYDPVKDFAPITLLATGPHVIVAHPSVPANTLGELVALAKSTPGGLNYATAGIGSAQHLAGEMLKRDAGITIVHVPYKGGGAAIGDLVGGQVTLGIMGMAPVLAHIQAGRLKAIAVTSRSRSPVLPSTPTVAESGVPGFESVQWFGVAAPLGTPRPIVDRLHQELQAAMKTPELKERLASIGAEAVVSTPQAFGQYLTEDVRRWGDIVKTMNIQKQ